MEEVELNTSEKNELEKIIYTEVNEPYGFIYITTNLVNGIKYLGQKKFDDKWEGYLGSGKAFKHALKKYGKENFVRNIIYICFSAEELNAIEYELSVFFNVVESDDWYNLVYGGGTTAGMVISEETRKKLSETRRKNSIIHPEFDEYHGQKMIEFYEKNPEVKKRISNMFKQCWQDPDCAKKMLKAREEYWKDNSNHIKHSKAMKKAWENEKNRDSRLAGLKKWQTNPDNHNRRSELAKRNWGKDEYKEVQIKRMTGNGNPMYGVHRYGVNSPNFIPVFCLELNRIFWGVSQAGKELHINRSDISRCCKKVPGHNSAGKLPTTQEKLHWLYASDAIMQGYITQIQLDNYLNSLKEKETDIDGNCT